MASSSQQIDIKGSDATPYEQEFQTEVEKELVCDGQEYEKLKNGETVRLGDMNWGRVPFELKLERILDVTDDGHKDLILHVTCNRRAPDPHWRIRFTVTVQCNIHQHDEWECAEQSMTANRKFNTLVLPVMRMPADADVAGGCTLRIKIKMSDWAGNFPAPLKSFTEKTDVTDATLIVEGRQLFVSRAILSIHSTFFHTMFYNRGFADAAKDEFDLPDLSFDSMQTFLALIYPNVNNDAHAITSMDEIDAMLTLAERFGSDSVTRLMERYLMGETGATIEGFTVARRLLLADRFRLSAPCSHLMARLRNDDELNRLGETDEYNELSDAIRGAILDMSLQNRKRAHSVEDTSKPSSSRRATKLLDVWAPDDFSIELAPGYFANSPPHRAISPPRPLISPPPAVTASAAAFARMMRDREMLQRQQVATAARMAAAAAADSTSWVRLQSNMRLLARTANAFALSSTQSRELDQAIRYLQSLGPSDYNAISSARRDSLSAVIRELNDPALHNISLLSPNVDRFIREVDALRDRASSLSSGPERKRARMP